MSDGLIKYVPDSMDSTIGYVNGVKVASVWGPTIDGGWCVAVTGQEPRKYATKEEALMRLPATWPPVLAEMGTGEVEQ